MPASRRLRQGAALLGAVFPLAAAGCRPDPPRPAAPASASGAPLPSFRFADKREALGVRFAPDAGLRSPMNILDTAGYGGGLLDYDGDGRLDLLLVGNPGCRLFRNGGERFEDVTAASGLGIAGRWMGCASADWDNDGKADLLLTGYRTAALFRNAGSRFQQVALVFPADHWGSSAVFFDYDGDGWLDLYVACYVRFDAQTKPQLCTVRGVQLACPPTYYDAQQGHLYRNLKGRGFQEVTASTGLDRTHGKTLGAAACDMDGDGDQDLYLANDGMPGNLFVNDGGRFSEQGLESGTAFDRNGLEQAGMGVDWGDPNEDGRPDLVVTTFQMEPDSLYINGGGGIFTEQGLPLGVGDPTVTTLGFGVRFFDADNDGRLELGVANGHVQDLIARAEPDVAFAQAAQLFSWRGERFMEVGSPAVEALRRPIVGRALATGDWDNDGRTDLLLTNLTGQPLVLRNETASPGHWMALRLEGDPQRRVPRDGTGAVVTVRTGDRKITRFVSTGGSYLACSDPRVHAGLGTATAADEVIVRWPGGLTERWSGLAADREHRLRLGTGLPLR